MSDLGDALAVEKQPKKQKYLTEMERHEGWIENLKNEERTMKE